MWPLQPKLGDADRLPAWVQREPEAPVNGDRAPDQIDPKAEEARFQDLGWAPHLQLCVGSCSSCGLLVLWVAPFVARVVNDTVETLVVIVEVLAVTAGRVDLGVGDADGAEIQIRLREPL